MSNDDRVGQPTNSFRTGADADTHEFDIDRDDEATLVEHRTAIP